MASDVPFFTLKWFRVLGFGFWVGHQGAFRVDRDAAHGVVNDGHDLSEDLTKVSRIPRRTV